MRGRYVTAALIGATVLGACASAPAGGQPAWFAERESAISTGFPTLQSVPRDNIANTDAAYWAQVQNDLAAAATEMRNNPRAQVSGAPEDPNVFLAEARRELEQARLAHEPN